MGLFSPPSRGHVAWHQKTLTKEHFLTGLWPSFLSGRMGVWGP